MVSLLIDAGKCNKCRACTAGCPAYLIQIIDEEAQPTWINGAESSCLNCGHCVTLCPTGALELSSMPVVKCIPVIKELQPAPEQIEQFLKSRRSIRAYKEEPVGREKLAKLIDIARFAPSASNKQPVQWLVIEKREDVEQLGKITIDWLRELIQKAPDLAGMVHAEEIVNSWDLGIDLITCGAPHLIIAHAQKDSVPLGDCHIALTYLELAAHSMAIGACWAGIIQIAAIYAQSLVQALHLPENNMAFGALMIGWPKYKYKSIPMRNDAQVIWR